MRVKSDTDTWESIASPTQMNFETERGRCNSEIYSAEMLSHTSPGFGISQESMSEAGSTNDRGGARSSLLVSVNITIGCHVREI